MWRLFIFSVLVVFRVEARLENDPLNLQEITFTIESGQDKNDVPLFICDRNDASKQNNKYTVLEGEEFKIITNNKSFINYIICGDYTHEDKLLYHLKNVTTFIAEKNMGTLWNCTVLSRRDTSVVQPLVLYEGHNYSAAYCYMQIHVRQKNPTQTIRVNNMPLRAVRTDLSEKDVDFTAEYQYVGGDVVNVACIDFLGTASLTMEYPMADTLSDKFTSRNLSTSQAIGFSTKLHSRHNNSYMICTDTGTTDYTKVLVRFVMRTKLNIVSIKINGMTLRPILINQPLNAYEIGYKYIRNLPIKVVCEVDRPDVELVVVDSASGFVGEVKGYSKTELIPSKQSEMSFHLNGENKILVCGSDYLVGGNTEVNYITFSKANFPIDQYPLLMKLPPNGTVTELFAYGNDKSRNVIFYEFEDNERLQLKCGPLHVPQPGPVLYLQFKYSTCKSIGCYVTQSLTVTDLHDNSEIVCRVMEQTDVEPSKKDKAEDIVSREIRVIFRKRVLTTSTTTTPTTIVTTSVQLTDDQKSTQTNILAYSLSAVGVLIFVVLLLVYLKARKCCCYRSRAQMPLPRPDPAAGAYYENMLSVFTPINEREAEAMENHYEEIQ